MRYLLFFITLLFFSCVDDKTSNEKAVSIKEKTNLTSQNLNISFLLDLSDRVDPEKYPNPAMEFYERDVAYIGIVANSFMNNLKRKKVIKMNDIIQIYFDPEPQNPDINDWAQAMKFQINKQNASLELLDEIENAYSQLPIHIYESAINDNNYVGSDTWGFFQNKVKDYCIKEDHRNILVLLTDGYMYHENTKRKEENRTSYLTPQVIRSFGLNSKDWQDKFDNGDYGFIPANQELSDLEVLVLGINPDTKNPYEGDVLNMYWSKWLTEMGVEKYQIKASALPANMEQVIEGYIENH